MSDRLDELKRQRALVQQHLAWLDREIAAASPESIAPVLPASLPPAATVPSPEKVGPEVDLLLERYRTDARSTKDDVRKGCLLYFLAAFALLGAVIAGFALYFSNRT